MQPAGYHGNQIQQGPNQYACSYDMLTMRLGIVSDPGMTGWANYYGDFVTTSYNIYAFASPYEAYVFTEDDSVAFVDNMSTNHITDTIYNGANVSYSMTGSVISATYENSFDSIDITQVVTLDTAALYANFTITLTNTSVQPKNNLMYARMIYTNNDYVQTSNFGSHDSVEYNCPTDPYCLVTSRGMTDSEAYLALGSADTNSRCFIDSTWPLALAFGSGLPPGTNETLTNLYEENYANNTWAWYSGGGSGANAIGIVFSIPHLAGVDSAGDSVLRTTATMHPANTSTFSFFYSASAAASNQALGIIPPTGIVNINTGEIKMYPNPATTTLTIQSTNEPITQVSISNILGQTVYLQAAPANCQLLTVDVSGLAAGVYFVRVNGAAVRKFVKE